MRNKPIRIGTHGSRGSGKTCYYAALYGKRTDGDIHLLKKCYKNAVYARELELDLGKNKMLLQDAWEEDVQPALT